MVATFIGDEHGSEQLYSKVMDAASLLNSKREWFEMAPILGATP